MKKFRLRRYLPKSLLGRSIAILVIPIIVIQLIVGYIFFDRLFRDVTILKTQEVSRTLTYALSSSDPTAAKQLGFNIYSSSDARPKADHHDWSDFTGRHVIRELRNNVPNVDYVQLLRADRSVELGFTQDGQRMVATFNRSRVSARNPHQLLVAMTLASLLMIALGVIFLRNQVKPIRLLARSAEAFGKGRNLPYHPRGATEVRMAGQAFQAMKTRIEQQIQQRTLMLSGVSHDLRTPLTRFKLSLSMLDDNEEIEHLRQDVVQMEAIIEEFLAFSKGDRSERPESIALKPFIESIVKERKRSGTDVDLIFDGDIDAAVRINCKRLAVTRALDNLLSNAARYGDHVRLSVRDEADQVALTVEDNGPGIPKDQRDTAIRPFERLDAARNQNKSVGTGLGLAIATDIARNHGGRLALDHSTDLGGLKATIYLPR